MRRAIAIVGALVLVLAAAGSSHAVLLSDLLNGGSVTSGDKLFDNWTVTSYFASDPARSFNAANIEVTGLSGSVDPGLDFVVSHDELTVIGDDIFAYVDLMFGFKVTALDPVLMIKDASLEMNGYLSYTMNAGSDLGFYIRESIGTAPGLDDLGMLSASFDVNNDVVNSQPNDSVTFAPRSSIWVTKNILVWSLNSMDIASLQGFDQKFSQAPVSVPEPGMLALLALGGLALLRLTRG